MNRFWVALALSASVFVLGTGCGSGTPPDVTAGCGTVTAQGSCTGSVARYCDETTMQVVDLDCSTMTDQACGLNDMMLNRCIPSATTGSATFLVSGTFQYEKIVPLQDLTAFDPTPQIQPIRFATVQVRRSADESILASGATDNTGNFSIGYENAMGAADQVKVVALASASNTEYALSVRDCLEFDTTGCTAGGGLGNIHAVSSNAFTSANPNALGNLTATDAGASGAFNIFEIGVRVYDFARTNLGSRPPVLNVQWRKGNTIPSSFYLPGDTHTVFILGAPGDQDEYDDSVLGHEYGHFIEEAFSTANSPGGDHDGTPTNPLLAWGEGYGTFFGALIADSPRYIDMLPAGVNLTDISNITTDLGDPNHNLGISQPISEDMVAQLLWQIAKGDGTTTALDADEIFDVMGKYFNKFPKSPENDGKYTLDRGVTGVDLVDFLDGWFCRNHGNVATITTIVANNGFPYDFPNLAPCP